MSVSRPQLVGRDAELKIVAGALDAVAGGASRALGVLGEPGIGKSRLLGEIARGAGERGHLVLAGRASELELDVPFALWVDALDAHVAALAPDKLTALGHERLADLAVALPAVARACEIAPSPTVERHRVARAVRGLVELLAAQRPVVLLLDDVHWADPASADVVTLLLHRPPARAALLAIAARTGRAPTIEAALQRATRHDVAEVLEPGPLSREQAEALLPRGLGPAARAQLYRDSGGNPFFLEALAAAGAPGAGAAATPTGGVPRAVLAALAGEIARLTPAARALAQGAAVAGDPFELTLAARAAALPEAAALTALEELETCDLVRPGSDPRRWRFRHPLLRRAVYESAGGGWRLGAHGRAAALLEGRGATPGERAHHVARAAGPGDLDAVELLERAASRAASAAPATAAEWLEAALRLLPSTADVRRLALLRAKATALASAGRPFEAAEALRGALGLLAPDDAERVEVVIALAELEAVWTQQPDEARRMLSDERERAAGPAGATAALTLAMAAERAASGDHAATERLADEARVAARAAGDPIVEAAAAAGAADAAHCRLRGEGPEALADVDARLVVAGRLVGALSDEQVAERLHMLLSLTLAHLSSGSPGPARAAAQRGLAIARRAGQGLLAPAFVCMRGFVAYELGELDAAQADAEEALEAALISGNVPVAYWASIQSSWVALARGRPDDAIARAEVARDTLGTHSGSQAGFTLADARLAAGDPRGALDALEGFGWVSPRLWTLDRVKAAEVAVRVLLALDRVDEADAWARRAPIECGGRRSGVCAAVAAHARASVALARDDPRGAARHAATGAAAADAARARLWAGRCRALRGEALAAAGHVAKAREEARRAASELAACGAAGYRDDALRVLRRLGERPRPRLVVAPPVGLDGRLATLSPREREVSALLAEAATNAQIAHRLKLSESTVEKHVSRVLAKLGMSTRSGVAALLARQAA